MRSLLLGFSLVLGTASVMTTNRAEAQRSDAPASPESARDLFVRGQNAYSHGDYDTAIASWSRAYELDPRPLLQFNLSQAYERLGRLEEAVQALQRYLDAAAPNDEHQADARARQASLRERIARTGVRILAGPEGATILIDENDHGRTPHPDAIPVQPGSHSVVVRKDGYDDFVSSVVVPAGSVVDLTVAMRTHAIASPVAASSDVPIGPIVLLSAGGAAAIAGAILGGVALSEAQNAPSRDSSQADSARSMALGADIALWGGLAVAAGGAVWLAIALTSSSDEQTQTALQITPWAGHEGGGLFAHARF